MPGLAEQLVKLISAVGSSTSKSSPQIFAFFINGESKPKAQVMVTPRHGGT